MPQGGLEAAWAPRRQALAVIVLLVVATGALVVRAGDPEPEASPTAASTVPVATSTTLLAPAAGATPSASSTTSRPSTTTAPTSSTTTTIACRNSQDPACGPFRWDPAPQVNQPVKLTVSITPAQPRVGQKVVFQVVAEDADAQITGEALDYGDGARQATPGQPECRAGYGPWTLPKGAPGKLEKAYEHTYTAAGSFNAAFEYRSYGPCPDPRVYASEGRVVVPLVVSVP